MVRDAVAAEMFTRDYADVFEGDDRWRALPVPSGDTFAWDADSTYVRRPPYFEDMADKPAPVTDIHGARVLAMLGDSVTTDHISPAGAIKADSPAGPLPHRARGGAARLQLLRLAARQPRGDDPRHVRQHPAAQPAGPRHRGRGDGEAAGGRADEHLRRVPAVPGRGHAAAGARRQGVRLRLVAGLGGQGHAAARRAGGAGRVVRADPPLEPDRHGGAAAAVPPGGVGGLARAERPARCST